ncbi:MAG: hypothetical protein M3Y39_14175 [Chloroflexota bacterium]|nr:hypothetical protein [Chloroflexota bacterium]
MPVTRRKRANPPDQPENNTNHLADQPENSPEGLATERPAASPAVPKETEQAADTSAAPAPPPAPTRQDNAPSAFTLPSGQTFLPPPALSPSTNGERGERGERAERNERAERGERADYPPIEGGRRTARGEFFRRPPQQPVPPPAAMPPLQPPSHEIKLPLGKEPGDTLGDPLHLAYNPGYTGAEEARSALLQKLEAESKAGGRARCWNCGSLAIVYDRWNTRSKALGDVGVAFCEICGVWSVM